MLDTSQLRHAGGVVHSASTFRAVLNPVVDASDCAVGPTNVSLVLIVPLCHTWNQSPVEMENVLSVRRMYAEQRSLTEQIQSHTFSSRQCNLPVVKRRLAEGCSGGAIFDAINKTCVVVQ